MTCSGIAIREFRQSDSEAVLRLTERLTHGTASWFDPEAVAAAAHNWAERSIDAIGEYAAVFVAEDCHGGCLGFASVARKRHFSGEAQAYVGELAVAADAEGKGIGRMLMQAVETWAAERDYRCITLETGAANEQARGFYQHLGYQEESVTLTRVLR